MDYVIGADSIVGFDIKKWFLCANFVKRRNVSVQRQNYWHNKAFEMAAVFLTCWHQNFEHNNSQA